MNNNLFNNSELELSRLIDLFIKHNHYYPTTGEIKKLLRGEHSLDGKHGE